MAINMQNQEIQNNLVFLLGAGASIEAGVSDTRKFIYGEKEKELSMAKEVNFVG